MNTGLIASGTMAGEWWMMTARCVRLSVCTVPIGMTDTKEVSSEEK